MPGEDYQSWSPTAASNDTADTAINWREGMARAAVNDSARSLMAAHAKNRNLQNGSIVTTGLPNAQNFTSGVGYITAVPPNMRVMLKIGTGLTNTGPVTLNMDGIGAVTVKSQKGLDLGAGDLLENSFTEFLYNGTNWIARPGASVSTVGGATGGGAGGGYVSDMGDGGGAASGRVGGGFWDTSGTYIPSPNMIFAIFEGMGGGGSGGGAAGGGGVEARQGGGGGSGAYSRSIRRKAQIDPAGVAVTIGAAGPANSPGADGLSGTTTTVAGILSAPGGAGGTYSGVSYGLGGGGGAVGTGDFCVPGQSGMHGSYSNSPNLMNTPKGGHTMWGGGGNCGAASGGSANPGEAGSGYGSGGGGGTATFIASSAAGGAGRKGRVLITEFTSS